MFEIEFVDVRSGHTVRRKVPSHQLARQLAKDLALATGRRAIVRKAETSIPQKWRMVIVDMEMQNYVDGRGNLTAGQAWSYFRNWDHVSLNAVALPWPQNLPLPNWMVDP